MNRYICIHGHFYQPPRENPWLEEVELQGSAHPYHDWNARISAETYAPNAASRIFNQERKIIDIVNNYSKMSFNVGPTLLSWMERHEQELYKAIIEADKKSQETFSGHGSALAQAYNHMIMPLANTRDERTQVLWGIRDFEYRFKRKPEGMWMPETAVNTETLEILSESGIKFTILAPRQAGRTRKIGDKRWKDVKYGKVDPQRPYLSRLPSGRTIALFFYDGPVSQEIAFGGLLKSGEGFAKRLVSAFPKNQDSPRLMNIATDGETYGHHQQYGDMALAYCLYHIETDKLATITNYAEYLEKFPPEYEVEIIDDSSWSCVHGIERWKSNCGCSSGAHPEWTQTWREPLRNALDMVRDAIMPEYEKVMKGFTDAPWTVRDEYIEVVLDRSVSNVDGFFGKHMKKQLSEEEKVTVLKLLEMQRHAMLMYTSCGWFFDEISGIETTQILQYAARVIQLARESAGIDLEDSFITMLKEAPSNIPEYENGAFIYRKFVEPAIVDLLRAGAHYALSSLFEEYPDEVKNYCYTVRNKVRDTHNLGKQRIAYGLFEIRSDITREGSTVNFAVLHMGDHNLYGGVRIFQGEEALKAMRQDLKKAFSRGNASSIFRMIEKHFKKNTYSLHHLFRHEQTRVYDKMLASTLRNIESHFRQIYEEHYPLLLAKGDLTVPLPKALIVPIEFIINRDLLEELQREVIDMNNLGKIIEEVKKWNFEINKATVQYVASGRINDLMKKLERSPEDLKLLGEIESFMKILKGLFLGLNLWKAQNVYFAVGKELYAKQEEKANGASDENAKRWTELFRELGNLMNAKVA